METYEELKNWCELTMGRFLLNLKLAVSMIAVNDKCLSKIAQLVEKNTEM
jgi:hypothetical protein